MKKLFLNLLLMSAPIVAFAQLKVASDGTALIGTKTMPASYHVMLESSSSATSGSNYGVVGKSDVPSGIGIGCGVWGYSSNVNTGMNYGVVGTINSSNAKGAGVVGSAFSIIGYEIGGKYAGYFTGNTYVAGTLTANSVVQSSDLRLKENIKPLNARDESALDKLLGMNVVEYNYKKMLPSLKLPDSVSVDEVLKSSGIKVDKKHIGLIAQELQELYPELVEEGQDGYLAINYIELVPVLIRAIQELKEELDACKGFGEVRNARSTTSIATSVSSQNKLYQNTPNPFKEATTIRFNLADDAKNAAICIFDMSGKMLKKLPISSDMTSVSINGYELGEGMFLYALMVNGQEIDTKRMILGAAGISCVSLS